MQALPTKAYFSGYFPLIEPEVALGTTINEMDMFEDGQPTDFKETVPILSDAPHLKHPYATFGAFQLVGNGEQTNEHCGQYIGLMGCLRVELHNKITLDGENYAGKIDRRVVHHWCNKPSCPTCYKAWAVRSALRISARLKEASKRGAGQIEHLMISLPKKDYGLSLKSMRAKVNRLLKKRGVVGGVVIFHGFRYNLQDLWYFSPHFHVVGVISGGYICRGCKFKSCCKAECDGFDSRAWKLQQIDGYVCKVFGKRKTVVGTLYYQLNHASVVKNVERFHVYTYFGCVSYHKLKVHVELHKAVCRICRHDLIWIRYHGDKAIVTDRDSPSYVRDSFEDYMENGIPVYDESPKRRSGSYGYNFED